MTDFPETADIETSSDAYAARFDSDAGRWMLEVQLEAVLELMGREGTETVLDVGGGHGQLARPLCDQAREVTVVGSDPVCESRILDLTGQGLCRFDVGNVLSLPYADNSFHTVLCFRLLCHCDAWPQLLRELCRVASHRVILDYPTGQSLNALTGLLFGMKKKLEGNTRTYTLFREREILEKVQEWDFHKERSIRQFFWPMVLHRILNRPRVSRILEAVSLRMGLTR
ncbi:MAG: class I SAM-dependent methyltransferase, partial [Kiritimatiellia bacterium]